MNDRYYNVGLIDLEGMYKMCNEILDNIARGERTVIDIEEYIIYQQTAINDKINTELDIMSNYYRSDWKWQNIIAIATVILIIGLMASILENKRFK